MDTKFQNTFILLFAAILAGMVFIAVLFYRNTKTYESTSQWVTHTQTVPEEAEQVASLSKDMQLESAGFYFTSDSSFIPSFAAAKAAILQHLAIIKNLTVDNASQQQQRIDSLRTVINKLISFSETSLLIINFIIFCYIYSKPDSVSTGIPPMVILFSEMLSFFIGSFITAVLSAGKSIKEAAIACAVITILFSLLVGNVNVIFFGWLLPFFVGLSGAKIGEFVSAKMKTERI